MSPLLENDPSAHTRGVHAGLLPSPDECGRLSLEQRPHRVQPIGQVIEQFRVFRRVPGAPSTAPRPRPRTLPRRRAGGIEVMIQEQRRRRTLLGERAPDAVDRNEESNRGYTDRQFPRNVPRAALHQASGEFNRGTTAEFQGIVFFQSCHEPRQTLRDEKGDVMSPASIFLPFLRLCTTGRIFDVLLCRGAFRCAMAVWHVSRRPVYR